MGLTSSPASYEGIMNSLERISAAIRFERPDRLPVIAQVFGHAAVISGVSLDTYVQDGDLIASCQIKALERYGYDAVFSVMDVSVETEALGSVLDYRRERYPVVREHVLTKYRSADASVETSGGAAGRLDLSALDGMGVPDPQQAGRMPQMLKALRILRRELQDEFLIVGVSWAP